MADKTVLILGASGFVGSRLRAQLADGYRVVTTSRSGAGTDHAFDLADATSTTLFDAVAPDAIVNCAVSYGPTLDACFEVNVRQTAALVLALRGRPLHFVQVSSVSATPENRHHSDYGLTKYLADELVAHCLRASILRFAQIVDLAGRSASAQPGFDGWIRALRAGEPITVYDRAPRPRSYVPVETVVAAIELAIRTALLGTHDVIAPEAYTPRELVGLLAELAGYDPSRITTVDQPSAGYAIPACSPAFATWMATQETGPAYFARLFSLHRART